MERSSPAVACHVLAEPRNKQSNQSGCRVYLSLAKVIPFTRLACCCPSPETDILDRSPPKLSTAVTLAIHFLHPGARHVRSLKVTQDILPLCAENPDPRTKYFPNRQVGLPNPANDWYFPSPNAKFLCYGQSLGLAVRHIMLDIPRRVVTSAPTHHLYDSR